jgi:tetraacyldisaccharide 4'-kinase
LSVLSAAYGQVARLRRSWYERRPHARRRLARPVVSVGNLAAGGSGKTPVAAALARLLIAAGERPSILSRGYARRVRADGVVVVSDGRRLLVTVEESGDEPQMLARMLPGVPVIVSADRYLGGVLAERQLGCTVHILDDGFQHLQLARDVDLLLIHPRDLEDRVLPAGRLRERHDAAGSADALLMDGTVREAADAAAALGVPAAFTVERRFGAVRWLEPGRSAPAPSGGRVVAVAGIARPDRFFGALSELGWDVARQMPFSDHHWFTAADLAAVAAAVGETGADGVMTTEKDAARLAEKMGSTPDSISWLVLPLLAAIEPADAFRAWLLERVNRE